MANNDWKERLGVVFSTNPDFKYEDSETQEEETIDAQKQKLRVKLDRKSRGGKTVTLVTGFIGSEDNLKELGRFLKLKCGVGGNVKDGEIIIQGDFKNRIVDQESRNAFRASDTRKIDHDRTAAQIRMVERNIHKLPVVHIIHGDQRL